MYHLPNEWHESLQHAPWRVHTETVFKLVWLDWFIETGFKELLWFRLHVITYSPVEYQDDGPIFSGVGKDNAITLC